MSQRGPSRPLAAAALAALVLAPALPVLAHGVPTGFGWPTFVDVTAEAGLGDFLHGGWLGEPGTMPNFLEIPGPGACWLDVDLDGALDLYLVSGIHMSRPERNALLDPRSRLFLNRAPGPFVEVPAGDHVLRGLHYGCAAADYDDDGDADLYVTGWGGSVLLRNDAGVLTNVTAQAGVRNALCPGGFGCWASSASWLDYDRDGCLDLFVNNWGEYDFANPPPGNGPEHVDPQLNRMYRSRCDGTFEDTTILAGLTHVRHTWNSVAADLDNDGWVDLYLSNDGDPNDLYYNDRDGTFSHVDSDGRHGMGTALGDFDHNGFLDVVSTNFVGEDNAILRNLDGEAFVDIGGQAPFTDAHNLSGWATHWFDLQNDGHLDLMVLNGLTEDTMEILPAAEPVLVYENLDGGPTGASFRVVRDDLGAPLARDYAARGGAWADHDDDGDLDLVIGEAGEAPTHFLRADGGGGAFLNLDLAGTASQATRDAIGARVVVRVPGLADQRQDRIAGSGFLGSNDPRLHFGLGRAEAAEATVHWPDGSTQVFPALRANSFLRLVQGQAAPVVLRELPVVRLDGPAMWERAVPLVLRAEAVPGSGAGVASLAWDLGDGATATGAEVVHTYLEEGPFTVRVTATDTLGRAKVQAHRVHVVDVVTATVVMDQPTFLPTEAARGRVEVRYANGAPVARAAVNVRVDYSTGAPELDAALAGLPAWLHPMLGLRTVWLNGTTDAAGSFAFATIGLDANDLGLDGLPEAPPLGNHPGVYRASATGGTRWSAFPEVATTFRVGVPLP